MKAAAPTTTLRLSPPLVATGAVRVAGAVTIAPVEARGLTGSLRYTYVTDAAPEELRQAATLFWEEPPPRVIGRALDDAVRARLTGQGAPRRVTVRLDRFEEVGAGGAARALVALDADDPLGAARYCATALIADAAPATRARAFDAAIAAVAARFAADQAAGTRSAGAC